MWLPTLLVLLVAVVAKNQDNALHYLAIENLDIALDYLSTEDQVIAVDYLAKYGYLPADTAREATAEKIREAVRQFQAFFGLEQTGEVDNNMLEMMKMPRCGVRDVGNRTTRFELLGPKWQKRGLTYRITKYGKQPLTQAETDTAFRQAFGKWAKVSTLQFRKTSGTADIEIRFTDDYHGAGFAHASPPGPGAIIELDDRETFTVGSNGGYDVLLVATHEIGHSLGLDHSNEEDTIMGPYYSYNAQFGSDDKEGIQFLYGKPQ